MDNNPNTSDKQGMNSSGDVQDVPFEGSLVSSNGSEMQASASQPLNEPYPNVADVSNNENNANTNGADLNDGRVMGEPANPDDSNKPEEKKAAHAKEAQSAFMRRSSKMRKLYVVIIVLLVIVVAAIGFLAVNIIWTADNSATQQTQATSTDLTDGADVDDAKDNETPNTTVPNIVELLGKTRKQAISMIGHGADVVSSRKVKDEDSDIRRELRIELTDEPSDGKSGAPTVYLSLNKSGKVVHAGYSVATASLGYGSASFSDTVESEHIVENTLGEAGLNVELGSAALPEEVTDYTSYSSDGSTVTKEYCSFAGKGTASGKTYDWEAVLSYDYTVANASENLNDTLRTIFVYVS